MEIRKACFLDRDGVIIEEENYLSDPAKVRLCAGAVEALKALRAAGFLLIVVSNQAGIARGYYSMKELAAVQARVAELLEAEGARIDAWRNCPHHPKGKVPEHSFDCDCRKPKPGMLLSAAKELDVDLGASFIIGDKLSDVEAGLNAGCVAAALVLSGHGKEQDLSDGLLKKAFVAEGILPAAKALIAGEGRLRQAKA